MGDSNPIYYDSKQNVLSSVNVSESYLIRLYQFESTSSEIYFDFDVSISNESPYPF